MLAVGSVPWFLLCRFVVIAHGHRSDSGRYEVLCISNSQLHQTAISAMHSGAAECDGFDDEMHLIMVFIQKRTKFT